MDDKWQKWWQMLKEKLLRSGGQLNIMCGVGGGVESESKLLSCRELSGAGEGKTIEEQVESLGRWWKNSGHSA